MEENRGSTWKPLVIGLLAGAAMGAALGIVLAPRSGKETRHVLGDYAHKVRAKLTRHPEEVQAGSNTPG